MYWNILEFEVGFWVATLFETITITAITELTQGVTMSTMHGSKSDSFRWVKNTISNKTALLEYENNLHHIFPRVLFIDILEEIKFNTLLLPLELCWIIWFKYCL